MFHRTMPGDAALLNCLSYYREGLNAAEAEIASQEVLSFFKVFETGFKHYNSREIGPKTREWIKEVFDEACKDVLPKRLKRFDEDRQEKTSEKYV